MRKEVIKLPPINQKSLEDVHKFYIESLKYFFQKYGLPMDRTHISSLRKDPDNRKNTEIVTVLTKDGLNGAYYSYEEKSWKFCKWIDKINPDNTLVVEKYVHNNWELLKNFEHYYIFNYLFNSPDYWKIELERLLNGN